MEANGHDIFPDCADNSGSYKDDMQKTFEEDMVRVTWVYCEKCKEKTLRSGRGKQNCIHGKGCHMYSAENMDPGCVPVELQGLSYTEQLIARIHTTVSAYKIRGQQTGYSGNVINFPQDVPEVARKLPRKITDIKCMITVKTKNKSNHEKFRVGGKKVGVASLWLKINHKYYEDVEIDEDVLYSLPKDSNIEKELKGINDDHNRKEKEYEDEVKQSVRESCMFNVEIPKNIEQVEHCIEWPKMESKPVNEFKTVGYIAMAYPCLFPTGDADLNQCRKHKITPTNYFRHMIRYHYQRFAKHATFRFFAMNSIMRWRALTDGNVFVNETDAELRHCTVKDLKEMVGKDKKILEQIFFHGSDISGSRSFWRSRYEGVRVLPEQLGKPPTLFVTLSAADYHWPDLYRIFCDGVEPENMTEGSRRILMEDDPTTVDASLLCE